MLALRALEGSWQTGCVCKSSSLTPPSLPLLTDLQSLHSIKLYIEYLHIIHWGWPAPKPLEWNFLYDARGVEWEWGGNILKLCQRERTLLTLLESGFLLQQPQISSEVLLLFITSHSSSYFPLFSFACLFLFCNKNSFARQLDIATGIQYNTDIYMDVNLEILSQVVWFCQNT